MKRITLILDDDNLYRALKMEAAREGRSIKAVVSEALTNWLRGRPRLASADIERRRAALEKARLLLRRQRPRKSDVSDDLEAIRLERS